MAEWGRKEYSKAWPSRRPVWTIGSMLFFAGMLAVQYERSWTAAGGLDWKDYLKSGTLGQLSASSAGRYMSLAELCGLLLFELFGTHERGTAGIDLCLTDDKVLSGGLEHIDRELAELVDLGDPLHLRQQMCEQAEVPASEPCDRRRDFWRDLALGS